LPSLARSGMGVGSLADIKLIAINSAKDKAPTSSKVRSFKTFPLVSSH
jgi:hypothetical protein